MQKYIVVVGGVISGVGKGVTTAATGKILQGYGFSVTAIKIDPYLNCDAGTLRPTEHGEVWVTDDGGEIDQDLGNYERFLGVGIPRKNNITSGQVFKTVLERERKGEYGGKTVQYIPHVTDEIKRRVRDASEGYDFTLIEVGGTVGDLENKLFLFALRGLEREVGRSNMLYSLVTYMVVPRHTNEMKTKPTQQAIQKLSEEGIYPDLIFCRGHVGLDEIRRNKIETYANIPEERIISEPDVKNTIYSIPKSLEEQQVGLKIMQLLELNPRKDPDYHSWDRLVENISNPTLEKRIAMVGKYVNIGDFTLQDSYISINEALTHAGAHLDCGIDICWIDSKQLESGDPDLLLDFDGLIIPGGFGDSGVEGKINAIRFSRENNLPFLGLCYGMQLALVEYARSVCGLQEANTSEIDPMTLYPVIDVQESQKEIIANSQIGGTMRLGAYAAKLISGTLVHQIYSLSGRLKEDRSKILKISPQQNFRLGRLDRENENLILERHRHRYEVNPKYVPLFEDAGIVFSGYHIREDRTKLMEFIELPSHKFFVGTQGHPEFKSRLEDPAPLFYGFVKACLD